MSYTVPAVTPFHSKKLLVICTRHNCNILEFIFSTSVGLDVQLINKIDNKLSADVKRFSPDIVLFHSDSENLQVQSKKVCATVKGTVNVPLVCISDGNGFSSEVDLVVSTPDTYEKKIQLLALLFELSHGISIERSSRVLTSSPKAKRYIIWSLITAIMFSLLTAIVAFLVTKSVKEATMAALTVMSFIVLTLVGVPVSKALQSLISNRNR